MAQNSTCRLSVAKVLGIEPDGTVANAHVSNTVTSTRFLITSSGYFQGKGSTITFTTSQRGSDLFLTQTGMAIDSTGLFDFAETLLIPEAQWSAQACNLTKALGGPCLADAGAVAP